MESGKMTDETRLASLTTDALRAAGNTTIDEIKTMLKQAAEMQAKLHADAEAFIKDIGERSLGITDSVSAYVAFCEQTTKMFVAAGEAVHKLNGNGADMPMVQDKGFDSDLTRILSNRPR
jgi:hypothetical protein